MTILRQALCQTALILTMTGVAVAQDIPIEPLGPLGPPPIPADNPMTDEKIELGRLLFFDGRLSGNGTMGCVVCHSPYTGWGFPDAISLGYPGTVHWRNAQTVINSAYYGNLFWTGSSSSLEHQARSAARGAVGGNGEDDMMEARLAFVPEYREMFRNVFGDAYPSVRHAFMAIAAFERTLVQTDTPFDEYMRGDEAALTEQQLRGMELFEGQAGCINCHNGPLFSNQGFYNIGVPSPEIWETDGLAQITYRFELYAKGVSQDLYRTSHDDLGLYFDTKQEADFGRFRVPSLRYTVYTSPYMHNGAFDTLREVVEFYNAGGGTTFEETKSELIQPLGLSDDQIDDLVAFLESLSGDEIVMDFPELPEYAPLPDDWYQN